MSQHRVSQSRRDHSKARCLTISAVCQQRPEGGLCLISVVFGIENLGVARRRHYSLRQTWATCSKGDQYFETSKFDARSRFGRRRSEYLPKCRIKAKPLQHAGEKKKQKKSRTETCALDKFNSRLTQISVLDSTDRRARSVLALIRPTRRYPHQHESQRLHLVPD